MADCRIGDSGRPDHSISSIYELPARWSEFLQFYRAVTVQFARKIDRQSLIRWHSCSGVDSKETRCLTRRTDQLLLYRVDLAAAVISCQERHLSRTLAHYIVVCWVGCPFALVSVPTPHLPAGSWLLQQVGLLSRSWEYEYACPDPYLCFVPLFSQNSYRFLTLPTNYSIYIEP